MRVVAIYFGVVMRLKWDHVRKAQCLTVKSSSRVWLFATQDTGVGRDWTQVSHISGGFFTSWATREQILYKTTRGPPCRQTGSKWQIPPLTLPIPSPVPLAPPSSHVEGQRDTCWIFVHRKPTNFVPLLTMNPDSCWVYCKSLSFLNKQLAFSFCPKL